MKMVMFVLDDPNLLDDVLDAWHNIGVNGVTIIESTGLHRRRAKRGIIGARYSFGFQRLAEGKSYEGHYTLYTAVPDDAAVEKCLTAAEAVVGNLDDPNTGMLASWDLSHSKGVPETLTAREAGE